MHLTDVFIHKRALRDTYMVSKLTFFKNKGRPGTSSSRFIKYASRAWFCSLVVAQVVFVVYLIGGYGLATASGQFTDWNRFNDTAYQQGDMLGNIMYGIHVLLAIVMIVGGSIQLVPSIRLRYLALHKINGRVFVVLACSISLAGMYLILFRGTVGNLFLHSMTFFSGLVVLSASFFAIKAARSKQISRHQDWALRLYLAANGVLFFRLFIFAWFMLFGALGVNTDDFTGPTVYTVSVCSYVLPLVIHEWYRYAKKQHNTLNTVLLVSSLFCVSAIFLIGLVGISMASWYPSVFA